ncbi:MAG: NAD-dependent epimerase/dehydratase family protein [Proteobacteria bacterium]|nr:NAD-dependent epimerase/dehydratase family protein [Pseudomonadota bacterium]
MKVLVTGANGFIGSHLVEKLVQSETRVRCLVRRTSDLCWLRGLPVEIVYGDCVDKNSLSSAVAGVDCVYHLAGTTKAKREEDFFTINAGGTENLIRACLEHNPKMEKFVYLSSQAASGPGVDGRMKAESDPNFPISSYGKSKRIGEEAVLDHRSRIPVTILRPSAVYGPRDRAFLSLLRLIAKKVKFSLLGVTRWISMCFVSDLVDSLVKSGRTGVGDGEIFFISDGRRYRMEEIGDAFSAAMRTRAFRLRVPGCLIRGIGAINETICHFTDQPCLLTRGKAKEMVQENCNCDITKAKNMLEYSPMIDLIQGTEITVDWYRKNNWL